MKNMILLFKNNIKRSRITLIIAVIISILLCMIYVAFSKFGDSETRNIKVGLLDYDNSDVSVDFKQYLNQELHIDTVENESYQNLSYQLIDRKISAIIELPKGFEKEGIAAGKFQNIVSTTLDDYENNAFIKAYINIYFSSINQLITAAGNEKQFQILFHDYKQQEKKIVQNSAYIMDYEKSGANTGLRLSVGFFTMMMTLMSFCLALVVMEDRQNGVFNRIQISPVKSEQYIMGTSMFVIISSLIIPVVFCAFLWEKDYPISVSIGYLFLIMTLFILFMTGFALIAALFSKSISEMTSLIIILGTLGPILGGSYFSVNGVSESLQRISKLTPHYWLMQGIKDLIENPNQDVRNNIIILTLFAVLSLLVAAVKFVQKENSIEI